MTRHRFPALAAILFTLALAACGPDHGPVNVTFTLTNASSYDFVWTGVGIDDGLSYVLVENDQGALAGGTGTGSSFVPDAVYGSSLWIDAAAVDVDGYLYVWNDDEPREYTVAENLDITVVFTDDDCCWE